jgi:hypothetical protein
MQARRFVITGVIICCGFLVSEVSSAMEGYVGSDADGVRTLYKISFTGTADVALEPCVQFPREVGPDEMVMIALRPDKPEFYLFIGPRIVTYNLETKELQRRSLPEREVNYFTEPAFFSSTGRLMYAFSVGGGSAQGLVLDSDTLEDVAILPYRCKLGSVYAVAFASDESALCVARESSIVRYPIPTGGSLSFETVSQEATVFAELPSDKTRRLFMQGVSLLAERTNRNDEGDAISTDLTKLTAGDQVHLELKGAFLPGCERVSPLCSFDRDSEAIYVYDVDGSLRKKISAVFTELLTEDEVEIAHDDSGKAFKKLVGVRADGAESLKFLTGYMSPDGRFAAMVFNNGVRGPSYVSIVDISAGTVSPAVRVGKVDGGISNVVFRSSVE